MTSKAESIYITLENDYKTCREFVVSSIVNLIEIGVKTYDEAEAEAKGIGSQWHHCHRIVCQIRE